MNMFEVEYTDAVTGQRVVKEVAGAELARQTAKSLAKSSGRRVIVRKAPKRPWRAYCADLETGNVVPLGVRLSMEEATEAFVLCNSAARMKNSVLVFWPTWADGKLGLIAKIAS